MFSGTRAIGMIVRQTHNHQIRPIACFFIIVQFADKLFRPPDVQIIQIPGSKSRIKMPLQIFHVSKGILGGVGRRLNKFSITSVRNSFSGSHIPNVTNCRKINLVIAFRRITPPSTGISSWPRLFNEIRCNRSSRPFMTVCAYLGIHIEIVEKGKFFHDFMVIGRNLSAKQNEGRIAVPLCHISENLIICAVLFNNVNYVFYWRRLSNYSGDGVFFHLF